MRILEHLKFRAQPHLTWHFSADTRGAQARPVIALIHNFGGSEEHFSKHIQLLNDLGFDVTSFDLSWHKNGDRVLFFHRMRRVWSAEVKVALSEILQKRELITFTFSGIGVCTIDAVASLLETQAQKITAMIFDSGPFNENEKCVENMLRYHFGIRSPLLRTIATVAMVQAWDPKNTETTQKRLDKILTLHPEMPILSIQAMKDKIVPDKYIKQCFERVKNRSKFYRDVEFSSGGHLTSLKEEPSKYQSSLKSFLFG